MRYFLLLPAAAILATLFGCAQNQPIVEIKRADMPVPVSCIPKDFEPNGYVPLDHGAVSLLAPSRRYLAIAGKLNLAEAEINRLLAVVKPCKKVDQ